MGHGPRWLNIKYAIGNVAVAVPGRLLRKGPRITSPPALRILVREIKESVRSNLVMVSSSSPSSSRS